MTWQSLAWKLLFECLRWAKQRHALHHVEEEETEAQRRKATHPTPPNEEAGEPGFETSSA